MNEPWDIQRKAKYRDHDLVLQEIPDLDFVVMKSNAIRAYVDSKETDQAKLIVDSFMRYLSSKGFRIVKREKF